MWNLILWMVFLLFYLLNHYTMVERQSEYENPLAEYIKKKYKTIEDLRGLRNISIFSTSPIRSRPKRTYDPTREFNDPEGSDVPMRLMRIESTKKDEWETLKQQLVEFGKSSGLFQNIEIQNLGGSLGAPFQIKIKVRGPNSNIIDVGYGVSQILPILVHIFSRPLSHGRIPTSYYNSLKSIYTQRRKPNYLLYWRHRQAKVISLSSLKRIAIT